MESLTTPSDPGDKERMKTVLNMPAMRENDETQESQSTLQSDSSSSCQILDISLPEMPFSKLKSTVKTNQEEVSTRSSEVSNFKSLDESSKGNLSISNTEDDNSEKEETYFRIFPTIRRPISTEHSSLDYGVSYISSKNMQDEAETQPAVEINYETRKNPETKNNDSSELLDNKDKTHTTEPNSAPQNAFPSFGLASGKPIDQPSIESLAAAAKRFELAEGVDFKGGDLSTQTKNEKINFSNNPKTSAETQPHQSGFETASGKLIVQPSAEALARAHKMMEIDGETQPQFVGFGTASGKPIKQPSAESIAKAQKMMGVQELSPPEQQFSGFELASGKEIKQPSKESIERAQKMLDNGYQEKVDTQFVGFGTASGKAIKQPSAESILKAQKLMGVENQRESQEQQFIGFGTASGKSIKQPSAESLLKAQKIMGIVPENKVDEKQVPEFVGFGTASGKAIKQPSAEALAKAQQMMESEGTNNTQQQFVGFGTASGKSIKQPSEKAIENAKKLMGIMEAQSEELFSGFGTASGKPIKQPSAEALEKAQQMMNGDEQGQFIGFGTASGKAVKAPLAEAMERAKRIITEGEELTFSGFGTASGKVIQEPSAASMERAQKMLGAESEQLFVGFGTASGKAVKAPSAEALARAQKLMGEAAAETQEFVGFGTASGKTLKQPSEESIAKAQQMMNFDGEQQFVGFGLANGKPAPKPSAEAQQRAANMFAEAESEFQRSPHRPIAAAKRDGTLAITQVDGMPAPILDDLSERSSQSPSARTPSTLTTPTMGTPSRPMLSPSRKFSPSALALASLTSGTQSLGRLGQQTSISPRTVQQTPKQTPNQSQIQTVPSQTPRSPIQARTPQNKKVFKPPKMINGAQSQSRTAPATPVRDPRTEQKPVFKMPEIERESLAKFALFNGLPSRGLEEFSTEEAEKFRFPEPDFRGVNDVYVALIEKKVEPMLLTPHWVRNHYKFIVWKLKSLDLGYPNLPPLLTFDNVVAEMLYRVQTEIYSAKRSCIKLIYERDAPPNIYMVLAVSAVLEDGVIELTDGWYGIPAALDLILNGYLQEGKIRVGQKLRICNAALDGDDPSDPLDPGRNTRLMLRVNSVRRARWDARLGFQETALFPVSISSLLPNGGTVPFIEVIIQRRLPMLFRETPKVEGGQAIIRNQQMQTKMEHIKEQEMADALEKARPEWQKELDEDGTHALSCCPQLQGYLDANDQQSYLNSLPIQVQNEVKRAYENHCREQEEYMRTQTEQYMRDNAVEYIPFFTVMATDLCPERHRDCEITFWRPPMELFEALREGSCARIFQLDTSESRSTRLMSKGSPYINMLEPTPLIQPIIYNKRRTLSSLSELEVLVHLNMPLNSLVDVAGYAFYSYGHNLFLCDGSSVIVSVEIRFNGVEDYLSMRETMIIENLRYQSIDKATGIVQLAASESTIFMRGPNRTNKKKWDALRKNRERVDIDSFHKFVERAIHGYYSTRIPRSANEAPLRRTSGPLSVVPFTKIVIRQKGEATVAFFDPPFLDIASMDAFLDATEWHARFNMLFRATDGIGTQLVKLPSLCVNRFFSVIGDETNCQHLVTKFFDEYFAGNSPLVVQKNMVRRSFQIDLSSTETILRVAIFHSRIVYDEEQMVKEMMDGSADPIFPFYPSEWIRFSELVSTVIAPVEFHAVLVGDENKFVKTIGQISPIQPTNIISDLINQFK